jgi:Caspase domain
VAGWAIVVGIDDYGAEQLALSGAVADAENFRDWLLGAGLVSPEQLCFLAARAGGGDAGFGVPTKDTVVAAINHVLEASGGEGETLYVFFSGHGLTTWVSGREEGALLMPGFDENHPEHSLSIRSVLEFFETVQFGDQFFFIDACRSAPKRDFDIGRWPIPRRRDPGKPPVQQFVLYATSPGLTAAEDRWQGLGEFTKVLIPGLRGGAKAWSWDRNCYEVRWEKLADHVKAAMEAAKVEARHGQEPPEGGWPIQVPQDTGSRGVQGRQRDALLVSIPRTGVEALDLKIVLEADPRYDEAEISVLDAVAEPVATALKVTGEEHVFALPPKTYAVVARTTDRRVGRLRAPIELYDGPLEKSVGLAHDEGAPGEVSETVGPGEPRAGGEGSIVVEAADPLTVVELRDEAGEVLDAMPVGLGLAASFTRPAGFYRVRAIGPEGPGEGQFVVLEPGPDLRPDRPKPAEATPRTIELAKVAGGRYDAAARAVSLYEGGETLEWATPSTLLVVELGTALTRGDGTVLLRSPLKELKEGESGIAFYGVDTGAALAGLRVRVWPAGEEVPSEPEPLPVSDIGTVSYAKAAAAGPHWLSIEQGGAQTVVALPVLPGRLATVVAQFGTKRPRVYQLHPTTGAGPSSAPERLRRVQHLQRLLLGGRIDGAARLAEELAAAASEDPFAGVLAGYANLRIGVFEGLEELADAVVAVAPGWSDPYILRGEAVAHGPTPDLAARDQAFAQAVNTGIPIFGEGLTRLVEGLRASGFSHPRGTLVRHIFQRHARGLMWAAFTPLRPLEPGRLVISGADLGYEG